MRKYFFLFTLLSAFYFANAQTKQIKGVVVDESGTPLEGVSLITKGTRIGVQTDAKGNFTISIPTAGKVLLTASYVGFKSQTIDVSNQTELNIRLSKDGTSLSDVVVIGYQTVRRRDVLASVASIGAKDLKDIPINSAAEALNGRLAGVTATTSEGSPDASVQIRVRGGMSITGDNSPLYIVDGVQIENGLNALSPQDIQSIDVLKDAAATAIYGARGANGVIVITTKSGRKGKVQLAYNAFVGIKKLRKKLDVLNPYDFVVYQSERSRGTVADSINFVNDFGTTWDTLNNYKNVPVVDWQSEVFGRTGILQTHNLSASGGGKKFTYNAAYTYNRDKAIVLNSNFERHLFLLKGEYAFSSKLKALVTTRYTNQTVIGAGVSDDRGTAFNRLRNTVKYRPFLSDGQDVDDNDPLAEGNVGNGLALVNPVSLAYAEFRKKTTDVFNVSASITYKITKNLTFKSTFGYDQNKLIDRNFNDSITPFSILQGSRKPITRLDTIWRTTLTNSNVLSYSLKNISNKHDLDVLVGQETYDFRSEDRSTQLSLFPTFITANEAFEKPELGTPFAGFPKKRISRYTSLSFFGRINYSFLDRYLFSFNVRADGASKFAPGKQWGFFPAASFAWRAKKERFLENVDWLTDLKLRAGFGIVGNNRINDYLYLTTFRNDGTFFYGLNNEFVSAFSSAGLVNEALRWESTVNRNFGIDISLGGRVDVSVDVYNNSSKDLLLNVPIAPTFGYSTQLQNIGETSNKGVEFQIATAILRSEKGLNWNASLNMSFNQNKVEALGVNQTNFFPAASWGVSGQPTDYIVRIGQPVGSMWGLVTDGFYQVSDFDYNSSTGVYTLKQGVPTNSGIIGPVQPGSIRFKDLNGDGIIDLNNDRTIIGNPTPKFTGGINQQLSYKGWDMSLFINFSYGNDVYNANKIELSNGYTPNSNLLSIVQDRWRTVTATGETAQWINSSNQVVGIAPDQLAALNAGAKMWMPLRAAGAFFPHSWAIEDGSFLRINNLTVGYTIPSQRLQRIKISKLRFYVTANNLAVITNYTGYDPEVSVRSNPLTPGLDYSAYPKSRSFLFGLNATF